MVDNNRWRTATVVFWSLVLASAMGAVRSQAGWRPNGVATTTTITTDSDQSATMVPDGQGGTIVVWHRFSGGFSDLYAQRVDRTGTLRWGIDGVAVCTAPGDQMMDSYGGVPVLADGTGGCVIVWTDARGGDNDIYAQRLDNSGGALWGADGTPVCQAPGHQSAVRSARTADGDLIVAWSDYRSGIYADVFAQRLTLGGTSLWTADGDTVVTQAGSQMLQGLVADAGGGAWVAWSDEVSGVFDLYVTRVDSAGAAGVPIEAAVAPNNQSGLRMVSDGAGGALMAWTDKRNSPQSDIYAQRIGAMGWTLWANNGMPVSIAAGWQSNIDIAPDGDGGMFLTWLDGFGANYDVYAQHVLGNGALSWGVNSRVVRTGQDDDADTPTILADGAGGAIVAWEDLRLTGYADIYAQRMDAGGNAVWTENGRLICGAGNDQYDTRITAGDPGNVLLSWSDFRNGPASGSGVYAQRVETHLGNWGDVAGRITSAADVAADQGGVVDVQWDAGRLDVFGDSTVSHYSVWRAIPAGGAAAPGGGRGVSGGTPGVASGARVIDLAEVGRDFRGPALLVETAGAATIYWEWVGNIDAYQHPGYSMAVPTLNDSMAGATGVHYFEVITHTADRFVFWRSAPDTGYSIDNLAPGGPQGVAGSYDMATGTTGLWWHPNTEPDLARYNIYRGSGPDFVPTGANRIASTPDTTVTGLAYDPQPPWHLKVSAVDIHGNEGPFATVAPGDIATPVAVAGFSSVWDDGAIEVSWRLSESAGASRVTFEIARKSRGEEAYRPLSPRVDEENGRYRFRDAAIRPGVEYRYRVSIAVGGESIGSFTATASVPAARLALHQNHPNPFRPATTIGFDLPEAGEVDLSVYDVQGRRVATLVRGVRKAGYHEVPFPGAIGRSVPSGVYFYKLRARGKTLVRKMTLVR